MHSVFVHSDDLSNQALGTSGVISGRGAISVVYTMPMEDTNSMYEKISALLIPKEIRESGGFYNVAKELSNKENSKMTFSFPENQELHQDQYLDSFSGIYTSDLRAYIPPNQR